MNKETTWLPPISRYYPDTDVQAERNHERTSNDTIDYQAGIRIGYFPNARIDFYRHKSQL